ncbi:MAG: hypothetical protein KDI66_22945, partial [Xanthomonadales bacterium]|nr:hypothetical protein [Xanthomonadales bacterium]
MVVGHWSLVIGKELSQPTTNNQQPTTNNQQSQTEFLMTISRRTFLARGIGASSLMLFSPFQMTAIAGPQEDKAPLDRMIVEEFVRVAHSDLDKVKAMLEETPHLLNAAWDWKKGDFETAIGAAGHMGLKDTAN